MRQIKEKGYALRFQGKLGDDEIYTGDILAIGIGYWKERNIQDAFLLLESVITARQRNMNVR